MRRGVQHLQVRGKGGKLRYVPLHPASAGLIDEYLQAAGHGEDKAAPVFKPMRGSRRGLQAGMPLTADGVYKILKGDAALANINLEGFGPHSLRATAATNALDHEAEFAKVQEWLGHANRRRSRPEDSPTFKVSY